MPNVTASPRSNSNGEQVTEFLDTVNTTPTTYTFPNTQERLKVKNNGYGSFQLTVNGSVVTMLPSESKEFYGSIDSFVIASNGGVQSFEVLGSNYKDERVQLTGSNAKLFIPITATATDQSLVLPFNTKQVMIINEGADILNVAFDGKSSLYQMYLHSDPSWTFNGTWNTITLGTTARYSKDVNTNALFKPTGKLGVLNFAITIYQAIGAGIAKFEISTDGGTTWQNPSAISGLSRSDGVTGVSLNTYDCYNTTEKDVIVTFYLPFNGTLNWAIRLAPTGTKNASATDTNLFIKSAKVSDATILQIKPTENYNLEIQTDKVNISSPSTTIGRVIAI